MVQVVRRPVVNNPLSHRRTALGGSGNGSIRTSFWTCRLFLILYIVLQSCILFYKVASYYSSTKKADLTLPKNERKGNMLTTHFDKNETIIQKQKNTNLDVQKKKTGTRSLEDESEFEPPDKKLNQNEEDDKSDEGGEEEKEEEDDEIKKEGDDGHKKDEEEDDDDDSEEEIEEVKRNEERRAHADNGNDGDDGEGDDQDTEKGNKDVDEQVEETDKNVGDDKVEETDKNAGDDKVEQTNKDGGDDKISENEQEDGDDKESDEINKTAAEDQKGKTIRNPQFASIDVSNIKDSNARETLVKYGTGPAKMGYVIDLIEERNSAHFRNGTIPDHDYYSLQENEVKRILEEKKSTSGETLNSCEYIHGRIIRRHSDCYSDTTHLYAYNPASFARTLSCKNGGHNVIPAGGVISIIESEDRKTCLDRPAKYYHNPTNNFDKGIIVTDKPVKHLDDLNDEVFSLGEVDSCSVPCKVPIAYLGPNELLEEMHSHNLYVAGTDWKIIRSMEDPYYSMNSKIERTAFKRNIYYSTTSFSSSVPLSFFDFEKYDFSKTSALDWNAAGNKGTYLIDKECNALRRNKWLEAVKVKLQVESYGSCQHNTDLKADMESITNSLGRIQLQKKNRIALVFESGGEKDHITAPIWESLMSGSVPAILGSSNAAKHLPLSTSGSPSAVYASDFVNWDTFADVLLSVSENQTQWESFHKWRTDEKALQKFEVQYNFTRISPNCRLCSWAYAKLYGLGWDHEQQVVKTDTFIPRQICFAKISLKRKGSLRKANNLISHPFIEEWVRIGSKIAKLEAPSVNEDLDECSKSLIMSDPETLNVLNTETTSVTRSIFYHDGVTDIYIHKLDADDVDDNVALRLRLNVRNNEGAYFRDTHTLVSSKRGPLMSSASIQDSKVKVTVLANWETEIFSPAEGLMEITVKGDIFTTQHTQPRIRIITEDFNPLHDKITEFYPSYFGKTMTSDFIDPIEFFSTGQ